MKRSYFIGVDLGGTKITAALGDEKGNIIYSNTVPTKAIEGEEEVLTRILGNIEMVIKISNINKKHIKAIGIGSPGPLDTKEGKIITTPNLPFKNFNIVKAIQEKFDINTYLDNDANVAAIGEYVFGAGKGTKNMIFITVSTGIGAGAILNGKIYRGNTSNALEIGHMTLEKNGQKCNCGNYGCAESFSSGTAILKRAKLAIEGEAQTSLKKYSKLTSKEVFEEAQNGDKVAKSVISESLEYLGICVANIVTIFDPEMVVIGGGVAKAGKIIFDEVEKVVKNRCFETLWKNTKIVPAHLGNNAGVVGAIGLAVMEHKI